MPSLPDESPALTRFLETLYGLRPVDATFIGHHSEDHRLPDWSPAGHERALSTWSSTRQLLVEALGGQSDAEILRAGSWLQVDLALAVSHCDVTIAELSGRHLARGNPSLAIGEVAFGVVAMMTRDFLPPRERASWLLQRLRRVPGFLAGAMSTLQEAPIPAAWRRRALAETEATTRLLDEGLAMWWRAMGLDDEVTRALSDAAQLALGSVHGFATALEALPAAEAEIAIGGEELLATCLHRGHWDLRSFTDLLSELGVRRHLEQERLASLVRDAGARSPAEVQARLADRHPTPAGYYDAFARTWDDCRRASDQLVTWPEIPVRYVAIPRWTRMAAPALYYLYYRSPAPLDPWQTHDYVVPPIEGLDIAAQERHLRTWNDSVIKLNHVVHHGALGHHLQNWHAYRSPTRIGRIAAADCASRIAMLQGGTMAEGWACYATDLMDEAGFLTADERVAEQQSRVRLLARAVVDIELHTGRRSFDEAVRLYVETAGMSLEAARAEVVKNSMFPGTALMYWLGTQSIHDLRRSLSARDGAAFSLQAFHDRLLGCGSIPVAVSSRLLLREKAPRAAAR